MIAPASCSTIASTNQQRKGYARANYNRLPLQRMPTILGVLSARRYRFAELDPV
jgi:hypothetical protein